MKTKINQNNRGVEVWKRKQFVEKLAALEHAQWMKWSKAVAQRVDAETRLRWRKFWVPYAELSEAAKEQDRIWARKIVKAIDRAGRRPEERKRK
jgi:hypothetical protein